MRLNFKPLLLGIVFVINDSFMSTSQPTSSRNYVMTSVVQVAGKKNYEDVIYNNQCQSSITYFDGLGRPIQYVIVNGGGIGIDLISPISYDEVNRSSYKFLPYSNATGSGSYRPNALKTNYSQSEQYQFYQNQPASSSIPNIPNNPYNETVYEPSPYNRAIKQGYPGTDWNLDNSTAHFSKVDYELNVLADSVKFWHAGFSSASISGFYPEGQLNKTITTNEQGEKIIEFKDDFGNIVCKKVQSNSSNTQPIYVVTTYIYNYLGLLQYVLPPNAQHLTAIDEASSDFNNLVYAYHYDGRKRIYEKKIPGKSGWDYFIYNKSDRLVLSQDPQQRADGYWLANKYGLLGEQIMVAKYYSSQNRNILQDLLDASSIFYETPTNATSTGYTNLTFPEITDTNLILQILYYNDYSFLELPVFKGALGSNKYKSHVHVAGYTGLLTGQRVQVLSTYSVLSASNGSGVNPNNIPANFLNSVLYYDIKGQLVMSIKQNYVHGFNIDSIAYNFVGMPTYTQTKSYANNNVVTPSVEYAFFYEYDHLNRLISTNIKINNNPVYNLSKIGYNSINQIADKKYQVANNGTQLDQINYKYHSRGWLKSADGNNFGFKLSYNDPPFPGIKPQYAGNISMQQWGSQNYYYPFFVYDYDGMSRLVSGVSNIAKSESDIRYDAVGNILSLTRDGNVQTYTYHGNQLQSFNNGLIQNFTYNYNGSMITKGNQRLVYNELNLPSENHLENVSIYYTYDALGTKLRRNCVEAGNPALHYDTPRYYVDDIEYVGAGVKRIHLIQFEDGYIDSSLQNFCFFYKDHLNSVRSVVSKNMLTGAITNLGSTDYYPFGKPLAALNGNNRYLYNGKELQDETGFYDYGARMYDPDIGRWMVVDPMGEEYYSISPNVYCANNPVRYNDPNGMEIKDPDNIVYNYKKQLTQAISDISSFIEKGAISAEIGNMLIGANKNALKEVKALEKSDQVYNVISNKSSSEGGVSYDEVNGEVKVSLGSNDKGLVFHELGHAYQYEKGKISLFVDNSKRGVLYDLSDETESYNRERSINGGMEYFTNPKFKWNDSDVKTFGKTMIPPAYHGLPSGPIDINSIEGKTLRNRTIEAGRKGFVVQEVYKGWQKDYQKGVKTKE